MSRRTKSDELDAALRADPDYQDLRAMLHKQTQDQKRRFSQTFAEERNMESTEDITTKIVELKGQGLTYPQIAERLNAEGIRTTKGGAFTKTNVQQYVLRFNKRQAAKAGESCEDTHDTLSLAKAGDTVAKEEPDVEAANVGESFAHEEPDISVALPCEPCESLEPESEAANVGEVCEGMESEPSLANSSQVANLHKPCEHSDIPDEWLAVIRRVVRWELSSMQVTQTVEQPTANDFPTVPRNPGARGLAGKRETLPGCRVDEVLYNLFNADRSEQRVSASDLMNRILWHHYSKPKLSFEE